MKKEAEYENILFILSDTSEIKRISAATYLEITTVIDRVSKESGHYLDEMLAKTEIIVEPFTLEQAKIARIAYQNYGKGSVHKAQLNFGDCFSYALAQEKNESLLL